MQAFGEQDQENWSTLVDGGNVSNDSLSASQSMLLPTARGSTAAAIGGKIKEGQWMPELHYICKIQA